MKQPLLNKKLFFCLKRKTGFSYFLWTTVIQNFKKILTKILHLGNVVWTDLKMP